MGWGDLSHIRGKAYEPIRIQPAEPGGKPSNISSSTLQSPFSPVERSTLPLSLNNRAPTRRNIPYTRRAPPYYGHFRRPRPRAGEDLARSNLPLQGGAVPLPPAAAGPVRGVPLQLLHLPQARLPAGLPAERRRRVDQRVRHPEVLPDGPQDTGA